MRITARPPPHRPDATPSTSPSSATPSTATPSTSPSTIPSTATPSTGPSTASAAGAAGAGTTSRPSSSSSGAGLLLGGLPGRTAGLPPLSSSLDPQKTPVPPALLGSILATTASQAHLSAIEARADDRSKQLLAAGALSLHDFFRLAAQCQFGAAANRPTTYAGFKQALEQRGLQAEWRAMLDVLPRSVRDRHLNGKATPLELYAAWAADRSSWRARVEPVKLEVVQAELSREGRGHELVAALKVMTPGQRARLEAGAMTPREITDVMTDASTRQADVIIVGAGMAGLAAAQEMMAKGLKVVVLEASDYVGGRTKNASVGDVAFDQGAAWIHATDENPLTPVVKNLGLTMISNDAPLLAYGGKSDPLREGEKLTAAMEDVHHRLSELAKKGKDVSAATLDLPKTPYTQIATNTIGPLTMGVDWKDVSTLDVGSQPGENHGATTAGTPDMFVKEGLQTVTQSFQHGVPIRLGTPVSTVKWGDDGVVVNAGGVKFSGKKILMTASTGVLGSGRIGWDPPLPDWKQQAIKDVPMATFDKIAIRFDKDIFSGRGIQPGAFVYELDDKTAIDVVIRPTDKNVVVALVGGSGADALHKKGKAAAAEALLQKLERIYGPEVREHVTDTAVTNWRADPWHQGSFTATKPGAARAREKLRAPVDDTLFFAGEAQSTRWGGMLPGAYLTGRQAADEIVQALSPRAQEKLAHAQKKLVLGPTTTPEQQASA